MTETDPHHVWGDEPEERDASDALADFEATDRGKQERWHDRRSIYPIKVVGKFIGRNAKRVAVTIVGFALILVGIALLVLPGPGWALIFVGLAVLATEYVWAQRLLNKAKEQAIKAKDLALGKKRQRAEKKEARRAERAARREAAAVTPDPTATPPNEAVEG
ncbi:MAG: PGPGW domain-containing protein [Actinomycetota bacterium]